MTDEPDILLRDLLRNRLVDPNLSRITGTPYVVDNWPYFTNLSYNHFPRISITNQFESGKPFGIGSTTTINTPRLAIDIWVKPDNVLTIDSDQYEGFNEVRKISRDITEAIRKYWISDLAALGKVVYEVSCNWYAPHMDYDRSFVRRSGDISFVILRSG